MTSLSEQDVQALVSRAIEAREKAYAPYSEYLVGAALMTPTGKIYTGCNVENATFGASVCAERVAVFKAVSEGEREILAVAVVTANCATPCGICRQVISEFAAGGCEVIIADDKGNIRSRHLLSDLLPHSFGPDKLK